MLESLRFLHKLSFQNGNPIGPLQYQCMDAHGNAHVKTDINMDYFTPHRFQYRHLHEKYKVVLFLS